MKLHMLREKSEWRLFVLSEKLLSVKLHLSRKSFDEMMEGHDSNYSSFESVTIGHRHSHR